ncbi:MAG TPA: hypothetical protein VL053_19910 [Arachidicoccus sp.]|nr:hypothetical protein [Arachidicoccus sp.]
MRKLTIINGRDKDKMNPDYTKFNLKKNGCNLSSNEKKIFFSKLDKLNRSNVLLVYRGDDRTKVLKRYHNASIPHPFNEYLFMLGPKGKYFSKGVLDNLHKDQYVGHISDISPEYFGNIFDMLGQIFVRRFTGHLQIKMSQFKDREKELVQFFVQETNKPLFLDKIESVTPKEKNLVRDYYLNLLHHFSKNSFYPVSFLLSTSTSFAEANKFVKKEKEKNNEIVFFGWVPRGSGKPILHTLHYNRERKKAIAKYDLPQYVRSFFPKQHEVTLKGGLLPHYLIGYLYSENGNQNFEINPYFFSEISYNWIDDGLPVDQTDFNRILRLVYLSGGYSVDGNGNFENIMK